MKEDQNDKQVQLTQEGRDVMLQALVKKDNGGESFFSDKKNPSFKNLNVSKLMNRIKDSKGFYVINRDTMDKIIPEKENKTSGKPVTYASVKELFDWLGIELTTLNDRYRYTKNPAKEDLSTDSTENPINEEKVYGNGENVVNTSSATIKAISDDEKGKVTPQFPENIPSEMRVIINEKLQEGFIGRKFVFEEFELFRKKKRNGYFTIIANPGMGKSTIAAQYVMEQSVTDNVECAAFFIVSGGRDRPESCIQSICEQLKLTYKLDVDISQIANGQDLITSVFSEVLQEVSDRHLHSEKLVIVIDALDELTSQGNNRGNICYLPRYLPENIYFLLTRRNFIAEDERLRTDAGKQNFRLGSKDNMKQCEDDAREYIEYQLNNERYGNSLRDRIREWNINEAYFIEELQKKSQANFMYLRYVIPAITEGIYKDISLSGIANGLWEYYEDHWRITNVSEGFGLSVIAIFIVAERETSIRLISEVLEITVEQVKAVVTKCIQFLDAKALSSNFNILIDKSTRYSFYHKDYQDFLQKEKMSNSVLETVRNALIVDNESDGLDEFLNN